MEWFGSVVLICRKLKKKRRANARERSMCEVVWLTQYD